MSAIYRKKGTVAMAPWNSDVNMQSVSVSDADKENGSPQHGDMIAENPKDSNDRWLVAKKYFEENYEKCS